MRIWLLERPTGTVTPAAKYQILFNISGVPPSGFNNNPGFDYSPAVLRLRQFLGDVAIVTGQGKLVEVNS